MANTTPLIKFDVCIYKKEDQPEEEFFNWATKVYPIKAAPLIKKHGIVKWSQAQTIQPVQFRDPLRHALKTVKGRPEWTIPNYDMVTTYWIRNPDDMQALTTDPEWAELEKEACTKSNMSIGHFVVGHEIVHFEDKEAGASS